VIPGSHTGKLRLPFKPGSRFEIDPAYVDGQGRACSIARRRDDLL
jgi:hypothetical protein